MDMIEAFAEMLSECEEPKGASIEEINIYWTNKLAVALRKMTKDTWGDADKLEKINNIMREFVPKLEKIIKGGE